MRCRSSWSLSTLGSKHACDKNRRSSVTYASISSVFPPHPIPSSRTTKCVVCCCPHIKSRSDLYSVPSNIRIGPTDANAFHGHTLTTQKGYTTLRINQEYFFEKNSWIVRDGSSFSDCAPDEIFQGNFWTPPTQIILEKSPRKKRPDGHKVFRKINISALSGRHCGPHPSSIK